MTLFRKSLRSFAFLTLPLAMALPATSLLAQEAATEPEYTAEEKAQIIEVNQAYKQHREERAKTLREDMKRTGERVETGIDSVLKMLKQTTDSKDSKYRISQQKQEVIDGLKKSIEDYAKLRDGLKAETRERDPSIEREEIYEDIAILDEKINTRVTEIIDLAGSMQSWEDIDKYRVKHDDSWYGDGWYRSRNPDYYQNRSDSRRTEGTKDQLLEDLANSIERIERETKESTAKRDNPNITPQYREMLNYEIQRNEEMLASRQAQRAELASPGNSTGPRKVSRNEALTMEGAIKDIVDDISDDYDRLSRLYHEFNEERQALKVINARLEKYGATTE